MNYQKSQPLFWGQSYIKHIFILCVVILAGQAFAQPGNNNKAYSFTSIDALPFGPLRSGLEKLAPAAQGRARFWLESFDFPASDVAYLRADKLGGIFYEDAAMDATTVENSAASSVNFEMTEANVFSLHSKPGAARTVYLDMDGHVVTNSVWNAEAGLSSLEMLPFDTDGDNTTFNSTELNEIADTWQRLAEDYSPFDIDVTTEQPAAFGPNVGHILISPRAGKNGELIYPNASGGVAYVNVWGGSNFTYYQPALVFPEGTAHKAQYMAEAAAHELGHNLGLSHDGASTVSYYEGHGAGVTGWAPIMGSSYYQHVTQWSKGEYADSNNTQDDIAIITESLNARTDDHHNTNFSLATPLLKTGTSTIIATNPVTDPRNTIPNNKGIIENNADIDLFSINVGAGEINLTVAPTWTSEFSPSSKRGSNLDIQLSLYNDLNQLIVQNNPSDETSATITTIVPAGQYYLAIRGVGVRSVTDGYSDYASNGQYFINGTVPEEVTYTTAPSAPTDVVASLTGENSIILNWTDLGDTAETNESSYKVYRSKGPLWAEFELIASLNRDTSSYIDNNLANGEYSYYLNASNTVGENNSNNTSSILINAHIHTYVSSESTLTGIISSGSYLDTATNISSETLTEVHQGGRPNKRVSALEHIWTISSIVPGETVTLNIDAEVPLNSEEDNFIFSYSVDGNTYTELATIQNGTERTVLSTILPSTLSSLDIKVTDSERTAGNGTSDSIIIHKIEIISAGEPVEQAPVVTIASPNGNTQFEHGSTVTLTATATDYEDGDLSSFIIWAYNNTDELGRGASISISNLAVGTHQITASTVDFLGNQGSDTLPIVITNPTLLTLEAPVLSVQNNGLIVTLNWVHNCTLCTYTVVTGKTKSKGQITFDSTYPVSIGARSFSITESNTGAYYYKVYASDGSDESNIMSVRLK